MEENILATTLIPALDLTIIEENIRYAKQIAMHSVLS